MQRSRQSFLLTIGFIFLFVACSNKKVNDTKDGIGFDYSNIDSSFTLCSNFYEFANKGWFEKNPIPETESRWGSFSIIYKNNKAKLRAILESSVKNPTSKSETQLGNLYKSLMDSDMVNKKGIEPIREYIKLIDNISTKEQVLETMITLTKETGSGSFFGYGVSADSKNSSMNTLYLYQGGLGLPDRDYYFPKSQRSKAIYEAYKSYIANLFTVAKFDNPKKIAKDVINVEEKLAKESSNRVERRDPIKNYNKMTVQELTKFAPGTNWKSLFELAELKNVNELVVGQPKFIKSIPKLISKLDIETLKNYIKFQLLNDFAKHLSEDVVAAHFEFYGTTLRGLTKMKPRWEKSLGTVNGVAGMILGKIFAEKHFPESAKNDILNMIKNINIVFKERVSKLDWMSDATKEKAIEKLNKFTYKIGYPDKWVDYSSVEVSVNNPIQNILNFTKFEYNRQVTKLYKKAEDWEWGMAPHVVNAYYSPRKNEIVFPAGILQPPFYDLKSDPAFNYGGIGGVIAHEFSHGFDDSGSKYDGDGNLNNWWTAADSTNFFNKANKLATQFDSYTVNDSLHVNGKLTLGENIADLGGITLAYYAYLNSLKEKELPTVVNGFDYKQRFFLGWAQIWASHAKKETKEYLVKTDPHSPPEYRVKGPLSNLKEFDEAFNCTNKNEKIVIW